MKCKEHFYQISITDLCLNSVWPVSFSILRYKFLLYEVSKINTLFSSFFKKEKYIIFLLELVADLLALLLEMPLPLSCDPELKV